MKIVNLAKKLGVTKQAAYARIARLGYSPKEFAAFSTERQIELYRLKTTAINRTPVKWSFVFADNKFEIRNGDRFIAGSTSAETIKEAVAIFNAIVKRYYYADRRKRQSSPEWDQK